MEFKLKTTYDEDADAAYIYLEDDPKVAKSVEMEEDIIFDFDSDKKIVGIEVLNAKDKLKLPGLQKETN